MGKVMPQKLTHGVITTLLTQLLTVSDKTHKATQRNMICTQLGYTTGYSPMTRYCITNYLIISGLI